MKIVGLHIEQARVSATVVEKGFRSTELKDSFSASFSTEAELIAVLTERSRDWAGAKIIASIPGERFSQRLLHFPFSDRKRLEKALPFELEDSVPYALDDVVIDHMVVGETAQDGKGKGETPVLSIMLPKKELRQQLDLLAAGGLDPQALVPSPIGLAAVSRMVPTEGVVLFVAGNDLCLKNGEMVIAFRSFSASPATGGAAHTLKALETVHGVQVEKVLVLGREHPVGWENLGIVLEHVVPEYNGKKVEEPVSLGLALSGEINFRKGEYAFRLADEGTRKRKRIAHHCRCPCCDACCYQYRGQDHHGAVELRQTGPRDQGLSINSSFPRKQCRVIRCDICATSLRMRENNSACSVRGTRRSMRCGRSRKGSRKKCA